MYMNIFPVYMSVSYVRSTHRGQKKSLDFLSCSYKWFLATM